MTGLRVGPVRFRQVALAALVAQAAIVVTGGAVRLTSSGLGCTTWPHCSPGSLTPEFALHPLIEFGNRMLGLAVGLTTLAVVAAAVRRRPYRRDLTVPSLALVGGFAGQAVLGGLTVVFDLHPLLVMAHFLLSMVLLVVAFALWARSGAGPGRPRPAVRHEVMLLTRALVAAAATVLALGTVVTGAGPNSGAPAVRRLPLPVEDAAQLHSDVVLFLTGLTLALTVVLRLAGAPERARRRCRLLLGVIAAQAAVGFTQYFVGLAHARGLVVLHVLGATVFWLATLALWEALHVRPAEHPIAAAAPAGYRSSRVSTATAVNSSAR